MLETLYKLMLSTWALRLNLVVDNLLGAENNIYSSHFICECTKNTHLLFHYAKQKNLRDVILHVDFEKAFDSISFDLV